MALGPFAYREFFAIFSIRNGGGNGMICTEGATALSLVSIAAPNAA
jgi:hypothetical protein